MDGPDAPNRPAPPDATPTSPATPTLVSVIIPTYNRAGYLPQTLDSLRAQTLRNHEVLVIDDGSTDHTADVIRARAEPIRYFQQKNAGPAAARNHGLKEARGEFVGFLDSDDLWQPRFLETMADCLLNNPQVDVAFCRFVTIDDEGRPLRRRRKNASAGHITARLFASTFITTPSVLARRRVICEAGGFDPSLTTSEDYDLWLRLSLKHRFGFVEEPLCLRRSHPGTQSRNGSPAPLIRKAQLLERFYQQHGQGAGIPAEVAHHRLAKVYRSAGKSSYRAGDHATARDLFRRSLHYRPRDPIVWLRYLLARLPGNSRRNPCPEPSQAPK